MVYNYLSSWFSAPEQPKPEEKTAVEETDDTAASDTESVTAEVAEKTDRVSEKSFGQRKASEDSFEESFIRSAESPSKYADEFLKAASRNRGSSNELTEKVHDLKARIKAVKEDPELGWLARRREIKNLTKDLKHAELDLEQNQSIMGNFRRTDRGTK